MRVFLRQLLSTIISISLLMQTVWSPLAFSQSRLTQAPDTAPKAHTKVPNVTSPTGEPVFYGVNVDSASNRQIYYSRYLGPEADVKSGNIDPKNVESRSGWLMARDGSLNWYPTTDTSVSERMNDYKQLPTNRSLTPIGEIKHNSNLRSQKIERPSQLHYILEWTQEKTTKLAKGMRSAGKSIFGAMKFKSKADATKVLETKANQSGNYQFGSSSAAFYVALGAAAAINLMIYYPDDPVAWQKYTDQMSDPVFHASLLGFIAVAGFVYSRIPAKTMKGQIGVFGLAMVAGSIASSAIQEFARDPATMRCLGMSTLSMFPIGPNPEDPFTKRDMEACDKIYSDWTTPGKLADSLMASSASLLAAGGIFVGGLVLFNYIGGLTAAQRVIQAIKIPKAPTNLISLIRMTVAVGLFIGAGKVADGLLGIESGIRKWNAAEFSFHQDQMGATITEIDDKTFAQWAKLKNSGWKDSELEPTRKQLVHYSDARKKWLGLIMAPSLQSFDNWRTKMSDYQNMANYSQKFYRKLVQTVETGGSVEEYVTQLKEANVQPPKFSYTTDDLWFGLDSKNLVDYLLFSTACGPEIENPPKMSAAEYIFEKIGFYEPPPPMIDDPGGEATRFNPPRIVRMIDDGAYNACEQREGFDKRRGAQKVPPTDMKIKDHNNVEYTSLAKYVQNNLREDLYYPLSTSTAPNGYYVGQAFDTWWNINVEGQLHMTDNSFKQDYTRLLIDSYHPTLADKTYRKNWCQANPAGNETGLLPALALLSTSNMDCPYSSMTRLSNGVKNHLADQLRLYLAMYLSFVKANQQEVFGNKFDDAEFDVIYTKAAQLLMVTTEEFADRTLRMEPYEDENQKVAEAMAGLLGILSMKIQKDPDDDEEGLTPKADMALSLVGLAINTCQQMADLMNVINATNRKPVNKPLHESKSIGVFETLQSETPKPQTQTTEIEKNLLPLTFKKKKPVQKKPKKGKSSSAKKSKASKKTTKKSGPKKPQT